MWTLFEVFLVPGSLGGEILSEETVRDTEAKEMTVEEAAQVGFEGIPDRPGTHVDRHAHVRDLRYDDNKEPAEQSPEWLVRLRTRASTSFSFWGAYIDSRLWNSYPYARLDQFFSALLKTPGLLELIATKLSGSLGMTAVLAAGIASHTR